MEVQPAAILLYNDECAICRRIGSWVARSASYGVSSLSVRPIGDDPAALLSIGPGLDIWSAYAVIHLVMPDGSMKTGGEAVAEVFRRLPNTRWFAGLFELKFYGGRPFHALLDIGYEILSEVRPLFGCESCGLTNTWTMALARSLHWLRQINHTEPSVHRPHFSKLSPTVARKQ